MSVEETPLPWQTLERIVERPQYRLTGNLDGSVQATLDPLRGMQTFHDHVRQVDEQLRRREGFGVETAFLYGSTITGTSLHPDAAYNAGRHPEHCADSDLDLALIVEDGGDIDAAAHAAWEKNSKWPSNRDERYPSLPVNPVVHTLDGFLDEFREPLVDADSAEELGDVSVGCRWPEAYREMSYLQKLRSFMTGVYFHPDYRHPDVVDTLQGAFDMLTDENGDIYPAVEDAFTRRSKDYSGKVAALQENYAMGRMLAEARADGGTPRDYEESGDGWMRDRLQPEEADRDTLEQLIDGPPYPVSDEIGDDTGNVMVGPPPENGRQTMLSQYR